MIDYNVNGGDSGVEVETCDTLIGSSTRSTNNLLVLYVAVDDGKIERKLGIIAPGKTHMCKNVVKKSLILVYSPDQDYQPSSNKLAFGQGSFAGYMSVDKTLYGLEAYTDYSEFIVS